MKHPYQYYFFLFLCILSCTETGDSVSSDESFCKINEFHITFIDVKFKVSKKQTILYVFCLIFQAEISL